MPRKGRVENLKPQNTRTKEEQREIARMGGKKSGEVRKAKADIRKAIQGILNDEYTLKGGKTVDGMSVIALNLFKMATDSKNHNSIQATKLILDLADQLKSPSENRKIEAEIKLLETKAAAVSNITEMDVEDLSPLAKMLLGKEDEKKSDDRME